MKTLLALLFVASLSAAEPQTLPAKAARWPGEVQRPIGIREATTTPASTNPPGYDTLYAASVQTRRPLVCWVGMKPRQIGGVYSLACLEFPEAVSPCVVVGTWERGKFVRYDLAASASDVEIIVRANAVVSANVMQGAVQIARPVPFVMQGALQTAPPPTYYPGYRPAASANFQLGSFSAGASYCPPGQP